MTDQNSAITLDEAIASALKIRDHYATLQEVDGQRPWTVRDRFDGMVGDIGALAKLLMAKDDIRRGPKNLDEEIEHEVNDLFWSVLVLANEAGVDLAETFPKAMDELRARIDREKADKNLWERAKNDSE